MDEMDHSENKSAPSTKAPMSKRCADLDKLIDDHCKLKGIARSVFEHAHVRDFNERSRFLQRNDLCAIDGILANDPRELMICFVAKSEGLAKVQGFGYTIIRADDG